MAKEEAVAEVEPPKKKGKMLIIILAVVVVLVIGGGVGAYLLLSKPAVEKKAKHGEQDAATDGEDEGEGGHGDDEHAPTYVKLEAFTVNLADQESFLQTEIQLMVADEKVGKKLNDHLPEVRDALIRLLSSKTGEDLSQQEGKDKLAKEIQKQVNDVLGVKQKSKGVKKVLFGAFIIQ
jgi:flagellar FliL protein